MRILSSEIAMSYAKVKAYVITSVAQNLMANFYLKVIKPTKPVRFFQTEKAAEKWLKSIQ